MTGMLTLSNLLAWSAQSALLVAAALLMLRIVRLDAPAVRHGFLRAVLAACLLLPLLQPHAPAAAAAAGSIVSSASFAVPAGPGDRAPGAGAFRADPRWTAALLLILITGALARLGWMGAGIIRLRVLRRAGEVASADAEQADLQRRIGTRATIRYVRRLGQPVTFGFRSPVVLLPQSLMAQHPAIQRAVLAHELWHVRRRDWMWTVVEEAVRAVCWFHPAIWMLLSRIQASREEVVDELTILTTGSRRSYVDALLAYADEPPLFAATAFARRRHLVHRLVLISKEAVMSARRVVAGCALAVAVTLCSGWYAVQAFPMIQVPSGEVFSDVPGPVEARARAVTPENPVPRRTWSVAAQYPAEAAAQDLRGSVVVRLTLDESGTVAETRVVGLSAIGLQPAAGARATGGRGAVDRLVDAVPLERRDEVRSALLALAHAAVSAVRQWRYDAPAEGPISFFVTVPVTPDPEGAGAAPIQAVPSVPGPPAAATRDRPGLDAPSQVSQGDAIRVGGTVKAPTKLRHVNPIYPADAREARVAGVVILETRIERDGTVGDVRVLRSIPMLDHAAEEAVRQWQFTPTLLNGLPVPVIMTVTVNFTLQ